MPLIYDDEHDEELTDQEKEDNMFREVFGHKTPRFQSQNNKENNSHQDQQHKERQHKQQEKYKSRIAIGTTLLTEKYHFLTLEDTGKILVYSKDKGVYEYGGEIIIEKELEDMFQNELKNNDIVEVIGHIRRKTYVKKDQFDSDLDIVNLENGLYNIRTGQFTKHTPEYYSLSQKPFSYNPQAISKHFAKFINAVTHEQDRPTAVDIIAYTFLRYPNKHEQYFILIGVGANGKSVYTGIITALHGPDNISNVSLKDLVKGDFALGDLENKAVNIDTELSTRFVQDMSILKKLTGRAPIRIDVKHKQAHDAILHSKLIFNTNQFPDNPDDSDARFRREVTLPFPNQFIGEEEDPDLLDKLTTKEELSGIFNIIALRLRTYMIKKQKVYVSQGTIQERREKARLIKNPIEVFKNEFLYEKSGEFAIKEQVYTRYEEFCKEKGLQKESEISFNRILQNKYGYNTGRKRITPGKDDRPYIWKDTGLSDTALSIIQKQEEEKDND